VQHNTFFGMVFLHRVEEWGGKLYEQSPSSKLLYPAYIITPCKLHLSDTGNAILAEGRRRYWSCTRCNSCVEYAGGAHLTLVVTAWLRRGTHEQAQQQE